MPLLWVGRDGGDKQSFNNSDFSESWNQSALFAVLRIALAIIIGIMTLDMILPLVKLLT
jgi:hypothetical protein